jgi:hypothetical protein
VAFGQIIPFMAGCLDKRARFLQNCASLKTNLRLFGTTQVVEDDHGCSACHNKILFCEDANPAFSSRSAIGQANFIKRHFATDCLSEFGVALLLRGL